MTDCVFVRLVRNGQSEELTLHGVHAVSAAGISPERAGFGATGELCLRIPIEQWIDLRIGDGVSRDGQLWYTVAEIRENKVAGSGLSHYKVIGRR